MLDWTWEIGRAKCFFKSKSMPQYCVNAQYLTDKCVDLKKNARYICKNVGIKWEIQKHTHKTPSTWPHYV